jgi:hypothetical protein
MGSELQSGFACRVCGKRHDVLPLSFSVKAPQAVTAIPLEELERRVVITRDQCVIDGRDFYLRGRIPVPILGLDEPFIWGVWAEISPKSFLRSNHIWHTEGREREPEFPGWLNNELPLFGSTINLEVAVQTQKVGWRPHFRVVDQAHSLAAEQRKGITLKRAEEIAELLLHSDELLRQGTLAQ